MASVISDEGEEALLEDAAKEIERLKAALRKIAEITPRTIEVQTDYGTDRYTTLVDDKAMSIARAALEGKE